MPKHTHDHGRLADAKEIIRISCVRHTYEDGTSVHLCGLDFLAHTGARVAVLGPNGSGKTTMLYHILGLMKPQEGAVTVFGVSPSEQWPTIRRRIGVVLQNVDEQLLAPTVIDDVMFSPRQYGMTEADALAAAHRALDLLGINDLADRVPHNLSGGEKRKVALAGALVMDPELLILDEPFEGLDPKSRSGLLALLDQLARERNMTIVMSTHDIDSVPEFADYAYVLAPGGRIALSGTPEELFSHADVLAEGNVTPPILAELFARLRAADATAPAPALSVADAVDALTAWKGCTE
ncbi:MAG: energy-coupling factor ABC transporter ATP-binding protein [Coriobacteriia bacterium]|nr:energy-coupling factor ABC transporter ATP-binding protein [Coriobacteriia bacterium]MBN2840891.1 energy-coupling factor ABC transporter ATP-binding protein [Coriobacteriia bacterium]